MPTTNNSPTLSSTIPIVDAPTELSRMGVPQSSVPSIGALRGHAYSGKFPYVRLSNGKLALNKTDLPAIARHYGAPGKASVQPETSAAA